MSHVQILIAPGQYWWYGLSMHPNRCDPNRICVAQNTSLSLSLECATQQNFKFETQFWRWTKMGEKTNEDRRIKNTSLPTNDTQTEHEKNLSSFNGHHNAMKWFRSRWIVLIRSILMMLSFSRDDRSVNENTQASKDEIELRSITTRTGFATHSDYVIEMDHVRQRACEKEGRHTAPMIMFTPLTKPNITHTKK